MLLTVTIDAVATSVSTEEPQGKGRGAMAQRPREGERFFVNSMFFWVIFGVFLCFSMLIFFCVVSVSFVVSFVLVVDVDFRTAIVSSEYNPSQELLVFRRTNLLPPPPTQKKFPYFLYGYLSPLIPRLMLYTKRDNFQVFLIPTFERPVVFINSSTNAGALN